MAQPPPVVPRHPVSGCCWDLQKQPGGEPVGNPKHTHPGAGQQQTSWLSAERMEWWEDELSLVAEAWGWSRVHFLSIASRGLHAFLPAVWGPVWDPTAGVGTSPLPRLLAPSWHCQCGKHCTGRCPLLHSSLCRKVQQGPAAKPAAGKVLTAAVSSCCD